MKTLIALLACSTALMAQAAGEVNSQYTSKEGRAGVAARLDNPDRDKTQKPEAIVAALQLRAGMTVADVGTGVGYMLPFLSKAVGGSGKVLGEDVQSDFLEKAKQRIAAQKLNNASLVLGDFADPKLPKGAVDVALVLDVYHHMDQPGKVMTALGASLKRDGHLVIVEFHKEKSPQPGHIQRDEATVIREVEAAGYRLLSKNDLITETQYLLTFGKR